MYWETTIGMPILEAMTHSKKGVPSSINGTGQSDAKTRNSRGITKYPKDGRLESYKNWCQYKKYETNKKTKSPGSS